MAGMKKSKRQLEEREKGIKNEKFKITIEKMNGGKKSVTANML